MVSSEAHTRMAERTYMRDHHGKIIPEVLGRRKTTVREFSPSRDCAMSRDLESNALAETQIIYLTARKKNTSTSTQGEGFD